MQNLVFTQLSIPEIRQLFREEIENYFSSSPFQPHPETDEIGGVEFASRITGKAIPTIYSLVSERKIPHSKRGKQLYFSKNELLDWIRSGKRQTATEIKSAAATY